MEIILEKGDITKMKVDAIVNAANSSLMGGGGVDGAIHRAGGPAILEECKAIRKNQGKLPSGEAVITTAGDLPTQYVIHTVGPIWDGGKKGEADTLRNCYINSLKLADENNVKTIAFPNISTGVYGYPKEEAAQIAIDAVKSASPQSVEKVYFVCFDEDNYQWYQHYLNDANLK